MVIKSVNLETVCGVTSTLPVNDKPEFAFAGKSNVGKSSLINALMNRKAYARTSAQPGKTQTINFYNINDALYYVDLPGYGFAKRAAEDQKRWSGLVETYLTRCEELKLVIQLIDMRHAPTADDMTMLNFLRECEIPFVIALTKCDKLNKTETEKRREELKNELESKMEQAKEGFKNQKNDSYLGYFIRSVNYN